MAGEPRRAGRRELLTSAPTAIPASELLPPAERAAPESGPARAAAGAQAFAAAGRDAAATATVFTSSRATARSCTRSGSAPVRGEVSPTRFMNSVHNAAAGYWSIATRSREPSTSLCCYDASFAAGLLECVAQGRRGPQGSRRSSLTTSPIPSRCTPLGRSRPSSASRWPRRRPRKAFSMVEVELGGGAESRLEDPALERLRLHNPAARSLPCFAALARGGAVEVVLKCATGASPRALGSRRGARQGRDRHSRPHAGRMCLLDEVAAGMPTGSAASPAATA